MLQPDIFPTRAEIYEMFLNYENEIQEIIDFVEGLAAFFSISPQCSTVVDVGSGIGRMLQPLAAAGFTVLGVEPDSDYRTFAEERYAGNTRISILPGTFSNLPVPREVDLIISINSPFYYQLTPEERQQSLSCSYDRLRKGGVLFIDVTNFLTVIGSYCRPAVQVAHQNGFTLRRHVTHMLDSVNAIWQHTDKIDLYSGDSLITSREEVFYFAIILWPELKAMLEHAGFSRIETFSSFRDRNPAPLSPSRIMVAAQK